eukprot:CAMPEP_0172512204 /NCGR_PEP_ID=MMETSP1066-20121228/242428_1 /TAXON_ID=671091 /ORGANISM="Coscinodiscus wailesii, Strain CCMP2513" /LENGTH=123 /DNA_ID=CAMNT_0013291901 /DNA_START=211 /DNA_END=582 /DNA_ORIENTATION=+
MAAVTVPPSQKQWPFLAKRKNHHFGAEIFVINVERYTVTGTVTIDNALSETIAVLGIVVVIFIIFSIIAKTKREELSQYCGNRRDGCVIHTLFVVVISNAKLAYGSAFNSFFPRYGIVFVSSY